MSEEKKQRQIEKDLKTYSERVSTHQLYVLAGCRTNGEALTELIKGLVAKYSITPKDIRILNKVRSVDDGLGVKLLFDLVFEADIRPTTEEVEAWRKQLENWADHDLLAYNRLKEKFEAK